YHPAHYQQNDSAYYQPPRRMSAALLAELTKPFHQKLLAEAKAALNLGQNEMAVVLAQTASEQYTEWAMATCFDSRGCKDLTGPICSLVRPLDIINDRGRKLYSVLTGDSPQKKPFWKQLKAHTRRRHDVVHRGVKVSAEQAN